MNDDDQVTCPECEGEGTFRRNITRNEFGVWDCDEEPCTACDGTGVLPALECAEDRQYRYAREAGAVLGGVA